jgi:hypothetical protein
MAVEQLKKNLAAISQEILSIDAFADVGSVAECGLENLDNYFKSACEGEDSLYSLIKNDKTYNVLEITDKIRFEINGYYKDSNYNNPSLVDKKHLQGGSCALPDILATKIFYRSQANFMDNILSKATDFDSDRPIHEHIDNLLSNTNVKTSEFETNSYYKIQDNILFSKLLNNSEHTSSILSTKPLHTFFEKNPAITDKFREDLAHRCKETYAQAQKVLCETKIGNVGTSDYRKFNNLVQENYHSTQEPTKLLKRVQSLTLFCEQKDIGKAVDISEHTNLLEEQLNLPEGLKSLTATNLTNKMFDNVQHNVRQEICEAIPPQSQNFLSEIEKCQNEEPNQRCSYLLAYKDMMDEEYQKTEVATTSTIPNESGLVINQVDSPQIDQKVPRTYSWAEASEKLTQSKLVTSFVGESNKQIKEEIPSNEIATNNTDMPNNQNVFQSSSLEQDSDTSTSSKKNRAISSHKQNQNEGNTNNNNKVQSKNESLARESLMRDLSRRMIRPKDAKEDSNSHKYSKQKKNNLVPSYDDREDFVSTKSSNNFGTDYYSSRSLPRDIFNDKTDLTSSEVEEFLNDQRLRDEGRAPSSWSQPEGNPKAGEKIPPYSMRRLNGDLQKLPGLEIANTPNIGYPGVVGDEVPEVVLYGSLAENLSELDPNTVLTYDPTKGDISVLQKLVKAKKPFVLRQEGEPNNKILLRIDNRGKYEMVKVGPAIESQDYLAFFSQVEKAFKKDIFYKII